MPKSEKIFTQAVVQRIDEIQAKQDEDLDMLLKTIPQKVAEQTDEAITETTKRLRKVEKRQNPDEWQKTKW